MTQLLRSSKDLIALISKNSERMRLLKVVSKLKLPDAWNRAKRLATDLAKATN